MTAYVIKFQNGTYYAGYGKANTTKLVYAKLYNMKESAIFILRNMSEFHYCRDKAEIIEIEIHERNPKSKGYGTKGNVYIDEFFDWENEVLNGYGRPYMVDLGYCSVQFKLDDDKKIRELWI